MVISDKLPKPTFYYLDAVDKVQTTTMSDLTIVVSDKLPKATFSYLDAIDEVQTTTISDLTKGKKAILSFQMYVLGFIEKSPRLKTKGMSTIACILVNDAFVMKAWKEDMKVNDELLLLLDLKAIGSELDLSNKLVGLGVSYKRYTLLAENTAVKF